LGGGYPRYRSWRVWRTLCGKPFPLTIALATCSTPSTGWLLPAPAIPGSVWFVDFSSAFVGSDVKGNAHYAWCVRGGQGVDPQ
jgi:hypothetical protein